MGNNIMQPCRSNRWSIAQAYEEVRIEKAANDNSCFVKEWPDIQRMSESSPKSCVITIGESEEEIRLAAGWDQNYNSSPYPLQQPQPAIVQQPPPYPPPLLQQPQPAIVQQPPPYPPPPLPAQVPIGFQQPPVEDPPYPPPPPFSPPPPVIVPRSVIHPPQPELGVQVEPVVMSRQPSNYVASPVLVETVVVPQQSIGIVASPAPVQAEPVIVQQQQVELVGPKDTVRSARSKPRSVALKFRSKSPSKPRTARAKSRPKSLIKKLFSRSKSRSKPKTACAKARSKSRSKPKTARAKARSKSRSKSRSQLRTARRKPATLSLSISSRSMKPARNLNGPADPRLQTAKSTKGEPKPRKKKGCCC